MSASEAQALFVQCVELVLGCYFVAFGIGAIIRMIRSADRKG